MQRINPTEIYEEDPGVDKEEVEGMIRAVEYEKGTLKGQRETLKRNKDKVQSERKKIELQKRELGRVTPEIPL